MGGREYLISARLVLASAAAPPLEDGAVLVRAGRIAAVGPRRELAAASLAHLALGRAVLAPGLINAHTHLALSSLEATRPRRPGMADWLREMRRRHLALDPRRLAAAYRAAVRACLVTGTTAVGDIVPPPALAPARSSPLGGVRFLEVLGYDRTFASLELPPLRAGEGLAPHAPYTTSADIYRGAARLARREGRRLALHVAESAEEDEFVRLGTGPLRRFREEVGRLPPGYEPAGVSPVHYLDSLGAFRVPSIAVHATFADRGDRALLARRKVPVVVCTRSNLALSGATASVTALLAAGVAVAIGTDSLASVPTLSLLDELRALRAAHPGLSAETGLDLATRGGAIALGIAAGRLEPGARADLAAFAIPPGDHTPAEMVLAATRARFVAVAGSILVGRRSWKRQRTEGTAP